MATKKRKGNPKYLIFNVTEDKPVLEGQTKKATLEWLLEQYEELKTDKDHENLAVCIYGENVLDQGFPISSIKCINETGVSEGFKKILKKELVFNDVTYTVTVELTEEEKEELAKKEAEKLAKKAKKEAEKRAKKEAKKKAKK